MFKELKCSEMLFWMNEEKVALKSVLVPILKYNLISLEKYYNVIINVYYNKVTVFKFNANIIVSIFICTYLLLFKYIHI